MFSIARWKYKREAHMSETPRVEERTTPAVTPEEIDHKLAALCLKHADRAKAEKQVDLVFQRSLIWMEKIYRLGDEPTRIRVCAAIDDMNRVMVTPQ